MTVVADALVPTLPPRGESHDPQPVETLNPQCHCPRRPTRARGALCGRPGRVGPLEARHDTTSVLTPFQGPEWPGSNQPASTPPYTHTLALLPWGSNGYYKP